jgi:hypothetical protein
LRAEATRRTGASYPVTAPRGVKRSAEGEPDDPRLTGDGPEAETIGESPRGQKRDADFPPDDPRLVAGGDESEVVNDMPTATGTPVTHRPASSIDEPSGIAVGFDAVFVPQENGQSTSKGQDTLIANESTYSGDGDQVRANDDSRPGHTCATCGQRFETKSRLHQHLRDKNHQVIDDHDDTPDFCESSDDDNDVRDRSDEQRRLQAHQVRQAVLDHFVREWEPIRRVVSGLPAGSTGTFSGVKGSPPGAD